MILEHVVLDIIPGKEAEYEAAFQQASPIIAATPGYIHHTLHRCHEANNRYLLLVQWESVDAHMVNFRQSPGYQEWRKALHHFYLPNPLVEHYTLVYAHPPRT